MVSHFPVSALKATHRHSPGLALAALTLFVLLLAPSARPALAEPLPGLTYLTEEYYPFNYTENGDLKGVSYELLRMVWEELGMPPKPVEVLPWARGYERVRFEKGTVLFSMARTPERERLFHWVGPIMAVRFVLIARKDRAIRLDSLDDLRGMTVGTLRGDVSDTLLTAYQTIASIQPVADMRQNIDKLMNNRLDMVAYEELSWDKIAARSGLTVDDFETVYVLRETPVYFAFNKDVCEVVVKQFQEALDRARKRSRFRQILDDYLN
ncbi:substrate-binding periplasmic protein [Pseudodesulfovibrio indicus]|uniref:Amino acid ABC transporter substrate-binding protein (PAAT family) n=1 Tax=Pseudodesulfovibrio indicus TaxID=1716143 RepID=A0A126QMH1_9BACT|nr:transporter substrate-binding domain-containing protein [Pseudodesulfovibrio indicus]AMK10635.1 hypothetical protein AWY79_05670 [Pseudodesulfovibrio indicus]TDT91607.1 amino acid ABC transporter substrate-binding protein (PAAT family) [Pseudodesulfovibrio indicus]